MIADCVTTYKIPCYKLQSPCKIYFKYDKNVKFKDLTVYISTSDPSPDETKFDKKLSLPNMVTVESYYK